MSTQKLTTELHDATVEFPVPGFPNKSNNEGGTFAVAPVFFAVKEAVRAFRHEHGKSTNFVLNMPATPNKVLAALDVEDSDLLL